MMELFDTHAHLDELEDIDSNLIDARQSGIIGILAVGQDITSNHKVLQLATDYPSFVFPALGLHPWALGSLSNTQIEMDINFINDNLEQAKALGEIGLDYDKRILKKSGKELQQQILIRLLDIAREFDRPVSLHSRYAWKDCLDIVRNSGIKKAVFHWYTGFTSTLNEIIEAGYYISATPAAEYHEEHRRAIKEVPVEKLLLETDCPVYYGRENRYQSHPADIIRSLKAAAIIKGIDENELAKQTTINAYRLLGL